ncbi:MAG: T9SS type A sorting domain-containing protein [Bacillota bacterium]
MKHRTIIIILTLLLIGKSYAQGTCGMYLNSSSINATSSVNSTMNLIPHTGTFRMLIVYCKFIDDTFDLAPNTNLWPSSQNTLPSWTSQTISSTVMSNYFNPSISGYFKTMSHNTFDVIGDVCPILYIPQHESSYYSRDSSRNISYLTEEIINGISPYVNFSDYDNNHDGIADMIAICFRIAPTGQIDYDAYQGIASLTGEYNTFPGGRSEIIKDGVKIKAGDFGSGTFQHNIYDAHEQLPIICHEIGHYLFGDNLGGDIHLSHTRHHGLMDTDGGGGVMNAYERELLGWVTPTLITSNQINYVITDALTTNFACKIPTSNTGYYYIENHEGINYYENSWKFYNQGPLMLPGRGILISQSYGYGNTLDIQVADGKWYWKDMGGGEYVFPFVREYPSPLNGESELDLVRVNTTSGVKSHPDWLGCQNNYFNMNYNQVFSPASNPRASYANFTMELTSGNMGGDISVNFYFTNPYAGAPSKPQNLKLGGNTSNNHMRLSWESALSSEGVVSYEISRKVVNLTGNVWYVIGITGNNYFIDDEYYYAPGGGDFTPIYKIKAKDNQNLYSVFSDEVTERAEPLGKTLDNTSISKVESWGLKQNYPNPFNPVTQINYTIKSPSTVSLQIYDVLGCKVGDIVNEVKAAGEYTVGFDGSKLPSGIYIYKFQCGSYIETKKMTLLK